MAPNSRLFGPLYLENRKVARGQRNKTRVKLQIRIISSFVICMSSYLSYSSYLSSFSHSTTNSTWVPPDPVVITFLNCHFTAHISHFQIHPSSKDLCGLGWSRQEEDEELLWTWTGAAGVDSWYSWLAGGNIHSWLFHRKTGLDWMSGCGWIRVWLYNIINIEYLGESSR